MISSFRWLGLPSKGAMFLAQTPRTARIRLADVESWSTDRRYEESSRAMVSAFASRLIGICFVGLFVLQLVGCDGQRSQAPSIGVSSSQASPKLGDVAIVNIEPDPRIHLRVGQRVMLRVVVAYTLTVDSATSRLLIQDANNTVIKEKIDTVSHGTGTLTFAEEFIVPDTTAISVFTPIHAKGQGYVGVDARSYGVVRD